MRVEWSRSEICGGGGGGDDVSCRGWLSGDSGGEAGVGEDGGGGSGLVICCSKVFGKCTEQVMRGTVRS